MVGRLSKCNESDTERRAINLLLILRLMLGLGACMPASTAIADLAYQVATYDKGILIDHGHGGYSEEGTWTTPKPSWAPSGQSYSDTRKTTVAGSSAKWTPNIPAAGNYRVYFYNPLGNDAGVNDDNCKIDIVHNGTTATQNRSLRHTGMGWYSLGDYYLLPAPEDMYSLLAAPQTWW
jgi:hypothetical protein